MRIHYSEEDLQNTCVQYFRLRYPMLKIIAIPNGGKRSLREAVRMKRGGVTAGVFDLFVLTQRNGYGGLWLEAKIQYENGRRNQLTPEQKEFQKYADSQNYKTGVFYTHNEFITLIENYLEEK